MGVGQLQRFQHALDATVLAPFAMQGVEDHVGLGGGQHLGDVDAWIDPRDLGPQPLQRIGAFRARDQADLAFRRRAAEQDGDMAAGEWKGHGDSQGGAGLLSHS